MRHPPRPPTYELLTRCRAGSRRIPLRRLPILYRYSSSTNGTSQSSKNSLLTLAIETSCDDTCVAVLEKSGPAARLLFNKAVTSDNRAFRGVHPIVATASHAGRLAGLVDEALGALPETETETETGGGVGGGARGLPVRDAQTGRTTLRRIPDFVSATRGPGMTSPLTIGLSTAKGLAVAWRVPLVGVHHMQAHALTPRLVSALERPWPSSSSPSSSPSSPSPASSSEHSPPFPFLTLLVSGGHTQLVLSRSLAVHSILAEVEGAALGDVLDKCGRLILPEEVTSAMRNVNYGAAMERFVFPGDPVDGYTPPRYTPPLRRADEIARFTPPTPEGAEPEWFLTPPLHESGRAMRFEFAGLGGQVQAVVTSSPHPLSLPARRALAYGAMKLAFEHLASRIIFALDALSAADDNKTHPHPKQHCTSNSSNSNNHDKNENENDVPPPPVTTLVVSGGVASNAFLRRVLRAVLDARGYGRVRLAAPPVSLCTDNAAMVAWAGAEMYEAGWESGLEILPLRRWSMDVGGSNGDGDGDGDGGRELKGVGVGAEEREEGVGGILGVGGWRRRGV